MNSTSSNPVAQSQPSIVEQLRAHAGFVENGGCADHGMTDEPWLLREAADRIEELEAALRHIVAMGGNDSIIRETARAALEAK